ncbi:uncharacterized protein LOC130977045 [Arachis stenosperma]|uniref:uncharacterized protein LOC130977045 n=1 Tax=Arachis stenosperma TaxID=217475 RepID=UPI0025AD8574|nr:uncharacterized protein LOC130977045 [Arachis stenosperma]
MASNINHQVATYYRYNYIHSALQDRPKLSLDEPAAMVLDGYDNYHVWRRTMNWRLEKTKTLWFAHGTDKEVMNEPIYGEWKTHKELVLSWIRGFISEDIKPIINKEALSNEVSVWRVLMQLYCPPKDQSIISEITKEINSLKQLERQTLMEYKIKFDALWMEYDMMLDENNDKSKREQERAKRFLDGLNDTFKATRSSIMQEKPFPSLERVFYLAAQEDNEAKILVMQIQPQPDKVHTGIEKKAILLPDIHEHELKETQAGDPFSCHGCKEKGCGPSYRCKEENCSGYVLHEECANAVLQRQDKVSHPFFKGEVFAFLEKPIGHPRVCDACRMEVQGFVYYRKETKKDTGLDLHPCCLKLRHNIPYEDSGATKTLTLQRDVPKKCVQCKRQKVGDDIKVKGWSYLTSDGDCFHVSCFKELFLEKLSDYFSEKKVVVSKMQTNNTVENNTKVGKVKGRSNSKVSSSVVKKMAVKIAPVILKALFAAIFGDPVSLAVAAWEAIVTLFNN